MKVTLQRKINNFLCVRKSDSRHVLCVCMYVKSQTYFFTHFVDTLYFLFFGREAFFGRIP